MARESRYLVMTPGFEIVEASDAYLQATMRSRNEIVGRTLVDVFFDDPDDSAARSVRKLTASVRRVLADKRPDVMAIQQRDQRCWKLVNSPILGPSGKVVYIVHQLEDVTEARDSGLIERRLAVPAAEIDHTGRSF